MNLNEYQERALETAVYAENKNIDRLTYTVLALGGEVGELQNKLKKYLRSGERPSRDVLSDELGDVIWYCAAIAKELMLPLEAVAVQNLEKLARRRAKNEIKDRPAEGLDQTPDRPSFPDGPYRYQD